MSSRNTIFRLVILASFLAGALDLTGQASGRPEAPGSRIVRGEVLDEKSEAVPDALVTATWNTGRRNTRTDGEGHFALAVPLVAVAFSVSGPYGAPNQQILSPAAEIENLRLRIRYQVPKAEQTLVITATAPDPAIDRHNDTIYKNTLFLRDDQLFETLDGGINAGQHEGGGKSIEVRRFGFNLDHGGLNGGLKVLVDDVPQNQATQGHGQGYLGSLKSLSPELVDGVDMINGPFSAEYGDFSAPGRHSHPFEGTPGR